MKGTRHSEEQSVVRRMLRDLDVVSGGIGVYLECEAVAP